MEVDWYAAGLRLSMDMRPWAFLAWLGAWGRSAAHATLTDKNERHSCQEWHACRCMCPGKSSNTPAYIGILYTHTFTGYHNVVCFQIMVTFFLKLGYVHT